MSSGSFAADAQAIATAASAFDAQADPIMQQALKLESIKGSASTTGKAYAPQGQAYHDAITQSLEKIIRTFSEKSTWVSATLSATGTDYTSSDNSGQATIRSSGQGA
jgi:hypothetical protein